MQRRWLILAIIGQATILAGIIGFDMYVMLLRPHATAVAPRSANPFTLVDQRGHVVTDRDLLGKPTVMFFGFTYCPDVCPTTLTALTNWMKALGPDADRLNVVYVTIDPQRDTPKQLALYLSSFDHRIRGLTGTPAQIAQIAREYGVYYQKVPLPGGNYTMDHSSAIYLLDDKGEYSSVMTYQETPAEAVTALRTLIHG